MACEKLLQALHTHGAVTGVENLPHGVDEIIMLPVIAQRPDRAVPGQMPRVIEQAILEPLARHDAVQRLSAFRIGGVLCLQLVLDLADRATDQTADWALAVVVFLSHQKNFSQ